MYKKINLMKSILFTFIFHISFAVFSESPYNFSGHPSLKQFEYAWSKYRRADANSTESVKYVFYNVEDLSDADNLFVYQKFVDSMRSLIGLSISSGLEKLDLKDATIKFAEEISERIPEYCVANSKFHVFEQIKYLFDGMSDASHVYADLSLEKARAQSDALPQSRNFVVSNEGIQQSYRFGKEHGILSASMDDFFISRTFELMYYDFSKLASHIEFALDSICKEYGLDANVPKMDLMILSISRDNLKDSATVQLPIKSFKNPQATVPAKYDEKSQTFIIKEEDLQRLKIIN